MKNVAKMALIAMVLVPVLSGCGRRCGHSSEPVMHHKLEKMKKEYGGK